MSPAQFMATHWQKKPLLVRGAMPNFRGFLTPADLCRLASKNDVVARAIITKPEAPPAKRHRLQHGPFAKLDPRTAPAHWTLLVQGIETLHDDGWALLQQFDFIPHARMDDLMVSWATRGGGVGAHSDLYDVFLLQGTGRRRWRIEQGGSLAVYEGDVRTLRSFHPQEEWVLEAGDMLYLPPNVAHEGESLSDDCMTWSIGFTQPSHAQLVGNFLAFLDQQDPPSGIIEDPDAQVQTHPGELVDDSVARVEQALTRHLGLQAGSRFDRELVAGFLGRLCTGRPEAAYPAPRNPVDEATFAKRAKGRGMLTLARPSRMLLRGRRVFLNGEEATVDEDAMIAMRELANTRRVALPLPSSLLPTLYHWYCAGFIVFDPR
jgi:50S ribosomal protein L16 3-hydroxylase